MRACYWNGWGVAMTDFLLGFALGVLAVTLPAYVRKDAPIRHARYKMRAKLAQAVWAGTAREVRVKRGRIVVH
jgi:hypothetical protein